MKNGIMTAIIQGILIVFIGLALGVVAPSSVLAQQGNKGDVKYTGDHGRNKRVKTQGGRVELITGTIYSVRGSTISMDGESFSLSGATIHDQLGAPVKVKDLHPGLKVKLVIRDGLVANVSIFNFFRGKVVTDPQEVQRLREMEKVRHGR